MNRSDERKWGFRRIVGQRYDIKEIEINFDPAFFTRFYQFYPLSYCINPYTCFFVNKNIMMTRLPGLEKTKHVTRVDADLDNKYNWHLMLYYQYKSTLDHF